MSSITGEAATATATATVNATATATPTATPTPTATAASKSKVKKKLPRVRCFDCEQCKRDDCGECRYCVRKKKFGGDGSCKEACLLRKCLNLRERSSGKADMRDPRQMRDRTPTPSKSTESTGESDKNNSPISFSPPPRKKRRSRSDRPSGATAPCFMYGVPIPTHKPNECAGCQGNRNSQAENDPILLCDGKDCSREYHMSCCIPPLREVPEGSFYCVDCNEYGVTYHQLHDYLESSAETRAEYTTSREYVEFLLKKHLAELNADGADKEKEEEIKSPSSSSKRQRKPVNARIPSSELWGISESHRNATHEIDRFSVQGGKAHSPMKEVRAGSSLGPEFLVGKPVRVYCPTGNNYHDGRIVDWRKATHLHPIDCGEQLKNAFYGQSNNFIASCEFLIRFPAGTNHRKKSLHCWIILEEHSLAVGVSVIWAQVSKKKGILGWKPSQTLLRTSLELAPVFHLLSEEKGQIVYQSDPSEPKSTNDCGGGRWALTMLFGQNYFSFLDLRRESIDLFSEGFSHHFLRSKLSSTGTECTNGNYQIEIGMALAFAEVEEQRRIREWHSMPLQNAAHKQALTIVDEGALEPLILSSNGIEIENDADGRPQLCPLIEQGLDRLWVMKLLGNHNVERSLDTAESLSCQLVDCTPASIAKIRRDASKE